MRLVPHLNLSKIYCLFDEQKLKFHWEKCKMSFFFCSLMLHSQHTDFFFVPLWCIFHVQVKSPSQHSMRHVFQTWCCPSNHTETVVFWPSRLIVQNSESCRATRLLMEQLVSGRKCRRQRVTHDVSWGLCLLWGISKTATGEKKSLSFSSRSEKCD